MKSIFISGAAVWNLEGTRGANSCTISLESYEGMYHNFETASTYERLHKRIDLPIPKLSGRLIYTLLYSSPHLNSY